MHFFLILVKIIFNFKLLFHFLSFFSFDVYLKLAFTFFIQMPRRRTASLGHWTPYAKRLGLKRQSNVNNREATEEVVVTLLQALSYSFSDFVQNS